MHYGASKEQLVMVPKPNEDREFEYGTSQSDGRSAGAGIVILKTSDPSPRAGVVGGGMDALTQDNRGPLRTRVMFPRAGVVGGGQMY